MSVKIKIILGIVLKISFTNSFMWERFENHCESKPNQSGSFMKDSLIASIIAQMQYNLDGSLTCTTIIADTSTDPLVTGKLTPHDSYSRYYFHNFHQCWMYDVKFTTIRHTTRVLQHRRWTQLFFRKNSTSKPGTYHSVFSKYKP